MPKIVIIGGGVAGLCAGIYAQKQGYDATIIEKCAVAGGNLTGWRRNGYVIDNCIHWLTGTNPVTSLYGIWREVGALGDVEIVEKDSLFTCEYDGVRLSLKRSIDEVERDMLTLSPEDRSEIRSLADAVRAVQGMDGTRGAEHNEKNNLCQSIAALPKIVKYHSMSTGELASRFKHPLIQLFIKGIFEEYFSAMALIYVFATFCGANGDIPREGSLGMAKRMTDKFTSLGGMLRLGKEVTKIICGSGKASAVLLSDGTEETCDYVVVTADPAVVFGKMLDVAMPKQLQKLYASAEMRRFSAYHTAFACDTAELPFDGDLIFELPAEYKRLMHTENLILREFSHEPSYSPEGKSIIQSMTFCYEDDAREFIKLRGDAEGYKARKMQIAEAVERLICDRFPQLEGKISCLDVWTPATYNRYVNSDIGSFMSFVMPPKSNPVSVSNKIEGLSNVLLATQWLQAPGGLPIAASAGKRAIEDIEKIEKCK